MNWTALLSMIPSFLALLASIFAYLKSKANAAAIQEVHIIVNKRLTELLEVSIQKAHAEGMLAANEARSVLDKNTDVNDAHAAGVVEGTNAQILKESLRVI